MQNTSVGIHAFGSQTQKGLAKQAKAECTKRSENRNIIFINLKETFSEPTEKLSLIRLVENSSSSFSAGAPIFCFPACISVL